MRAVIPLFLVCFACSSAVPATNTTPVTLQSQAPRPSLRASAAGDAAFLTLALRPHAWTELGEAVRAIVPPSIAPLTEQLSRGALFDEWLAGVTRGSRRGEVSGVLSWPGLDPARSIYIRVGEAPDDLNAALEAMDGQGSSFRHVMALPVHDGRALRAALTPFVAGCANEGLSYACDMGQVDFVDHEGWLFVVLHPFGHADSVEGSALMGQLNESEYAALHGDSPLAGLVRSGPIRGASVHHSAGSLSQALGSFVPGNVNQLQAAGVAELVGAFVRAAGYGRAIDTWAFAVRTQPLSLAVVGVLTEVGIERYSSTPQETSVPAPSANNAPIVVHSSEDLSALVGSTPSPLAYQGFGDDHDAARYAFRACGVACVLRGFFEPAAYLSMASRGRPLSALFDDEVRFEVHSDLPVGTVDVEVDLARMNPIFFAAGTRMFVRSRMSGGRWVGGVALSAADAEQSLAGAQNGPGAVAPSLEHGDPASLRCLLALGAGVEEGLTALRRAESGFAAAIEGMRAQLRERASCVSDPAHATERDGYLRAFEAGVAPLAGVTL